MGIFKATLEASSVASFSQILLAEFDLRFGGAPTTWPGDRRVARSPRVVRLRAFRLARSGIHVCARSSLVKSNEIGRPHVISGRPGAQIKFGQCLFFVWCCGWCSTSYSTWVTSIFWPISITCQMQSSPPLRWWLSSLQLHNIREGLLQDDLNTLQKCEQCWQMTFNSDECG